MDKFAENDFRIFEGDHLINVGTAYVVLTNNKMDREPGVSDFFTERFLFVNNYLDSMRIGYTDFVRGHKSFGIEDVTEFVTNFTVANAESQFRFFLFSNYKESGNKVLCFTKVEFKEVGKDVFIHQAINGKDILKNLKVIEGITMNEALKQYVDKVEKIAGFFKFVEVKE